MSAYCVYKCYTCFKALLFGEDLVSDSVGTLLSLVLRRASHGSIDVDVQLLSQVGAGPGAQMGAGRGSQVGAGGTGVQLMSQVGAGSKAQQCCCCRRRRPGGRRGRAGWL